MEISDPEAIEAALAPHRDRIDDFSVLLPALVGAPVDSIRRLLRVNRIRMSEADIERLAAGGRHLYDPIHVD
jgi:hypothetical protein